MSGTERVVLVVDDEPDILASLKDILELSLPEVSVHVARGGREALADLSEGNVGLMITDYRMPGMTGSELIERARGVVPEMPCVLMSAFPEAALDANPSRKPDVFLRKPLNITELVETSERLLSGSAAK